MKRFEVGHTYSTRSLCDYDCIYSFTVTKRTEQTVWVRYHDHVTARRIRIDNGIEHIDPLGRYSMAPVLSADRHAD